MKTYKYISLSLLFLTAGLLLSCKKSWLDKKPDQALAIPTTLKDCQVLLDNTDVFTLGNIYMDEVGNDDYYLMTADFLSRNEKDRNSYIWADGDVYQGATVTDWNRSYNNIFYANTVLETADKVLPTSSNQAERDGIRGQALFCRAFTHYNLAQIFCKGYNESTADTDLGLVLRLSSDRNIASDRASVKQTYAQIVDDLLEAKSLLPLNPLFKTRASRPAAFAMLARAYLAMSDYDNAFLYADSCLQVTNTLMDFNTDPNITPTAAAPFKMYNPEVIYHTQTTIITSFAISAGKGYVDSTLIQLYGPNDKRRDLFFKPASTPAPAPGTRIFFCGSYTGSASNFFTGLTTAEAYLIRAEVHARKGNTVFALNDVNAVYQKRWKNTVSFVPLTAGSPAEALAKIIAERRKELCFRCNRWTDLRRLNLDPVFAKTLIRVVNGVTYTLPPNSNKYAWPIPDDEMNYSHITQNPR